MNYQKIMSHIKKLGATHCQFISPKLLIPEERIWKYCHENKCGNYNKNLMCPPHTGTIQEIERKFSAYKTGILIQYSEELDISNNRKGVMDARLRLHSIILETENFLSEDIGFTNNFGMVGGPCTLCDECAGYRDEVCLLPDKARPSLEALGVDVVALLKKLNLDSEFHNNKVTWTGMVLIEDKLQLENF
jgi:predicted metal-binding protein